MSNTIAVQEVEYCKLDVHYEADPDTVRDKRNEIVNKFRNQNVPGFRPGHATLSAIKQHFRKEIANMLKSELAEGAVHEVIAEKNIKPISRPVFTALKLEESRVVSISGESAVPTFSCDFSIHKQPEFELGTYKDFEIPKPSGVVSSEELSQRMLQELRTRYGETTPYTQDDFIQMGDTIIVNFKVMVDNEEKLSGSGELLTVGRINIPEFSESILGMKIDEIRTFPVKFPENHQEFPNKEASVEVKLIMGSKQEPAPLDNSLAEKVGLKNFDELMENVRSTASNRVSELEKEQVLSQIINRLVEGHNFAVPQWIAEAEAQVNARNAGVEWGQLTDEIKNNFISLAEKNVKLSLVLQKIRENEPEAQLSDEEVFEIVKNNISKHSPNPQKVLEEIFKNGHLPILFNRVRDERVLEMIEKTCKFVD